MLTHLTNTAFVLGYLLVVACYIPQWARILRTRQTKGISPWLLGLATAGLALIQMAALGGAWGALLAWGNGAALVNVLITDATYLWVRRQNARAAL